jgi:outer membrane protein assembly factor BamD
MKKYIFIALLSGTMLTTTSCGEYNKVLKSTDYEYKYEAAKGYFGKGQYTRSATLLEDLVTILKGTPSAQESVYMLGMSYFNQGDYVTASHYFTTYYNSYPRGTYTELARYYSGKALYLDTPEPRLDQTSTYQAIQELQMFMEYFPGSRHQEEAQQMIFTLQDKLVMKDYMAAKLYYDLGSYTGNSSYTTTGNNYQACIVTERPARLSLHAAARGPEHPDPARQVRYGQGERGGEEGGTYARDHRRILCLQERVPRQQVHQGGGKRLQGLPQVREGRLSEKIKLIND